MNPLESLNRFDLYHYYPLDQQIDSKAAIDGLAPIDEWQSLLTFNEQSAIHQLIGQTRLVGRLQHSRPQFVVDGDCRADNRFGQRVQLFLHARETMQSVGHFGSCELLAKRGVPGGRLYFLHSAGSAGSAFNVVFVNGGSCCLDHRTKRAAVR
jgi:hypothetical protein